jgi:Ca2+-binding RTX toxin-like protein
MAKENPGKGNENANGNANGNGNAKGNNKITGTPGDDVIYGGTGNTHINGGDGNDTIWGGSGNNQIDGGLGARDRLYGEDGNDRLTDPDGVEVASGGNGNDTIEIFFAASTVITTPVYITGDNGNDTIDITFNGQDVSSLRLAGDSDTTLEDTDRSVSGNDTVILRGSWIGGQNAIVNLNGGNDTFINYSTTSGIRVFGGDGDDTLIGGGGNDQLYGGAGNDIIYGTAGNNIIDGGTGTRDELYGGSGNDTITDPDGARIVRGGAGDDVITITFIGTFEGVTSFLQGGDGNDTITLTFNGQNISNRVFAGDNNTSGTNRDAVGAGDGNDIITFNGTWTAGGNSWVNLNGGDDTFINNSATSTITVYGGAGNDILIGGGGNDTLYGGIGNDTLNGRGGNDTLYGGAGSDTYIFEGDFGQDTVIDQNTGTDADRIVFNGISAENVLVNRSGDDLVLSVKNTSNQVTVKNWFADASYAMSAVVFPDMTLTPAGIDAALANGGVIEVIAHIFQGTDGRDVLNGTSKNDLFNGGAGDDVMRGFDGNDVFIAGAGHDHMYGGRGSDTYYFNIGDGLNVVYDQAEAGHINKVIFGAGIFKDDLVFSRIDNHVNITIRSTGDQLRIADWDSKKPIDQFVFTEPGQSLTVAEAGSGPQYLYGTNGNDASLNGTLGNDVIYGLDGDDRINGFAGNDIIYGGNGRDIIDGGDGDDYLDGGAGNDTLRGGNGNDTLIGGTGIDHLYGGAGSDTYIFNIGDGENTIYDATEAGQTNKVVFGAGIMASDLNIYAYGSSVVIQLRSTGDILRLAQWQTTNPIDVFEFTEQGQSLTVADVNAALRVITGTDGADVLQGTAGNDIIYGGAGNDTIYGGAGNDTIYGGDGDDTIYVGRNSTGSDLPNGGNNFADGGAGNDRIFGGVGDDELHGGDGNDNLSGGDGNDRLFGGAGNDVLSGGNGDDYLDGGEGQDFLTGGAGNDILVYDPIDFRIWGGSGEDTLLLLGQEQTVNLNMSVIREIEHIDTRNGSGDNVVTLRIADVLRVSDTDIMRISGDDGDRVVLGDAMTRGADVRIDNTDYAAFTGGGATVYIQLGLELNNEQLTAIV